MIREIIGPIVYEIRDNSNSSSLYMANWELLICNIEEIISPLVESIINFGAFTTGVDYIAQILLPSDMYRKMRTALAEEFSFYDINISLKKCGEYIQKIANSIIAAIQNFLEEIEREE